MVEFIGHVCMCDGKERKGGRGGGEERKYVGRTKQIPQSVIYKSVTAGDTRSLVSWIVSKTK